MEKTLRMPRPGRMAAGRSAGGNFAQRSTEQPAPDLVLDSSPGRESSSLVWNSLLDRTSPIASRSANYERRLRFAPLESATVADHQVLPDLGQTLAVRAFQYHEFPAWGMDPLVLPTVSP